MCQRVAQLRDDDDSAGGVGGGGGGVHCITVFFICQVLPRAF
jgi:hypothetical protein